jgi:hypothetical protein
MSGLADPIAAAQCVLESPALFGGVMHAVENQIEMMLQQMLEQATGDGIAHIGLRMFCPAENELPDCFGVLVDEFIVNV